MLPAAVAVESCVEPGSSVCPNLHRSLFVIVPIWLLPRDEISPGAKLCYGRLILYAGREAFCYPKLSTLSIELGTSERQTRRYIRELESVGLIETERRGLTKSNLYHFLYHPWMDGEAPTGEADNRADDGRSGAEISGHSRPDTYGRSLKMVEKTREKTTTTAHEVVASPPERGSTTWTPPAKPPESSNQPPLQNIPTVEPTRADSPTSDLGGGVSQGRPTGPDTGEMGRRDGGEIADGRGVAVGPKMDIAKSNAGSEIRQLKAESEIETAPKLTELNQSPSTSIDTDTGSPNPEAPDQHPDPDPVDRAIASIRDDLKTTAGIRRVIEKGIERYGEERVIRNIGYCNQTGKSPKSYRAYLDLSIRGDWGVDFNPESEPPPDPTEAEREALKEIERRRLEVEQERQEAERIGAAFLRLPEAEQARLRAAFIDQANPFERRRAGRMTAGGLSRNISFVGFLKSRN